MTIIAGFSCADGILMCADTEETTSSVSKNESDKLEVFRTANGYCLCGGAGDASLFGLAVQRLERDMGANMYGWDAVEGVLDRHAKEMFDLHIKPYSDFPPEWIPELSLLIAVQLTGKTRLFKWERNFVLPVLDGHHDAIGVGFIQALPLLREHGFVAHSLQMFFFAVRIMQKVKRQVPGCGGKTDIIVLQHTGDRTRYEPFVAEHIEHFADRLDAYMLNPLFSLITSSSAAADQVNLAIDECSGELKKFREEYVSAIYPMVRHVKSFAVGAVLKASVGKVEVVTDSKPSVSETSKPEP